MPVEARLLIGFALASSAAYLLVSVAIGVAGRLDFYDVPAGYKQHGTPTPYLGGAAVIGGFVLAVLVASLAVDAERTLAIAGGVAVLCAVGTVDDRRTLSPVLRVAVEAALAVILWALGMGWDTGLGGAADLVLSVGWIVLVVNAFNLFDNMDGAAGTMGLVVATGIGVLGLIEGDTWLAATAGALAGACLGFLPHNMASPARIFLGDGGSMPVGFAAAALAMTGTADAIPSWQALVVGLMLVGIPLLDTALVVFSRRRRGVSILTGGQDHLTYRARTRLRTARLVATVLGGAQAVVAALALLGASRGSGVLVAGVTVYLAGAGATIAVLEREQAEAADLAPDRGWAGVLVLAVLGAGAGISPFFHGYYDSATWVPIGLGVVTACAAALIAWPPRLSRPGALVVGASLALAVVTLGSALWADSVQQAVLGGNRALVLVAMLVLVLALARTRRHALGLVAGVSAGLGAVALWVLVRMLGDEGSLFLGGRLNRPLAYINAEATTFAMGLWIAVALAERRRPALAGPGAALAALAAGLVLLSQSRGAALAVAGSALVVLAALPGRRRRLLLLGVVGGALAICSGPLLGVYDSVGTQGIPDGKVAAAGRALLLAMVLAGVAWAAITWAEGAVRARGGAAWASARRWIGVGLAVAGIAALAVGVVEAGRIGDALHRQYDGFVHLSVEAAPGTEAASASASTSRLASGAGNRYDYWRVALKALGDRPVGGVGAGGYPVPYFRERATTEDVRQPHSIELQVLSETGLLGGLALLAMFAGAGWAVVRLGRRVGASEPGRFLAVAGAGGAAAWAVHTSVDWMHLMPGVTAIALCLLAVVLRARPEAGEAVPAAPPAGGARRWRIAVALAAAAAVVVAGASLARQGLDEREQRAAFAALGRGDAAGAVRDADRALRLDGSDVSARYAKAAALASFDRGADAQAVLLEAADREPGNFVTWALLGDLASRRERWAEARAYYGRAHRLNPRDAGLARLAKSPRGPG